MSARISAFFWAATTLLVVALLAAVMEIEKLPLALARPEAN